MRGSPQNTKQAALSFFFAGLLPVVAFTVIEDQYGTWAGLMAGCFFGLGEVIYEKLKYKKVSKMTKFGNGLLLALGAVSLVSSEGIWFKLQPAMMAGGFALALWGSLFTKTSLLQRLMEAQGQAFPPPLGPLLGGLTFRLGFFFGIHSGLGTWAALEWTTQNWALLKGIGLTVSFVLYLALEILYLRNRIKRQAPRGP